MRRFALLFTLVALAACSANSSSPLPLQQSSSGTDSTIAPMHVDASATSGGVTFTVYASTPAFDQTLGENGIAYDGQGGLWISSPTAFEHFGNGHMSTETNGLGASGAYDAAHSIEFLTSLNGYVYGLGFDGENIPTFVRVASDGSRSIIPITGMSADSEHNFISIATGANALYVLWRSYEGVTRLDRISTSGAVLNETILQPEDSDTVFVSVAVQQSTGDAFVFEYVQDNQNLTRLNRYAPSGTLQTYYPVGYSPTIIYSRAGQTWTSMAFGSDGNLYIPAETPGDEGVIVQIDPVGGAEIPHTTPTADSYPMNAVLGSDGNVWFVEYFGNNLGRVTPSGQVTEYPEPLPYPLFAAAAPKNATENPADSVWFTSIQDYRDSVRATF